MVVTSSAKTYWLTVMENVMSKYFNDKTDRELVTVSNPTAKQLAALELTCLELDMVRDHWKVPFVVTSGLRKPKAKYSQHEDGYAIDFIPKGDINAIFQWMVRFSAYDQLILESKITTVGGTNKVVRWIHISYKETGNRHEAWTGIVTVVNGKETAKYQRYYSDHN